MKIKTNTHNKLHVALYAVMSLAPLLSKNTNRKSVSTPPESDATIFYL